MSTYLKHVLGRRLAIVAALAALVVQATVGSALGAASSIVKVNGTDFFCPFETPDANGYLFAITRMVEASRLPTSSSSRPTRTHPCSLGARTTLR
jgi:hypothetical protein